MLYQTKIGLEIHVHLATKSKLFCGCSTEFGSKANTQICPVCLGLPGSLPVFNEKALDLGIKAGLGLNCQIANLMQFERKGYFYPDLPKGFQISQFKLPLAENGFLEIETESGAKKIRIKRVHLEEDAGKLLHKEQCSYIDYNRCGIPLLEIVSEPDISSPEQAYSFLTNLKTLLQYLGVSNCNMEKGELRCDANISLRQKAKGKRQKLGTKVEVKNMNSFKAVKDALSFEENRQEKLLKIGKKIIQETRLWNESRKETILMRKKEESPDYRYFPEPDLPLFSIVKERIDKIKKTLPELPSQKRERFKKEYNLEKKEIEIFIQNESLAVFFEETISELKNWMADKKISEKSFPLLIKLTTNYLISDLTGLISQKGIEFRDLKITPENLAELITIIGKQEISSRAAKDVLKIMFETGADPPHIIEEKGLKQISDSEYIENIAKEIIEKNQKVVLDYKKGKESALEFLVGKIMAETKGKADPIKAREILKKILKT